MADDDSLRSDWQPPDWLTARPRPLASQGRLGPVPPPPAGDPEVHREVPPVPLVPDVPPEPRVPTATGVPPLPPRPAGVDPRPTLRSRPEDVERPEEACEIPVTRDVAREVTPPPEAAAEPVTRPPETAAPPAPEPPPTAAELADPGLTARLRAWKRVDQDLYRLLGYEETERLVFRDEGGDLLEAPGSDELAGQLEEAKFEVSRIEARAWRDFGLWGTAALVALLVTGFVGLVDWFPPFWTFVVVFLVSSFGRLRRRWRRRLDQVVKDHRLTYELVRKRLQDPT